MGKVVVHKNVGLGIDSVEYHSDDAHELPEDTVLVTSEPPSGSYKIYGLYLKPVGSTYKICYVKSDTPEP